MWLRKGQWMYYKIEEFIEEMLKLEVALNEGINEQEKQKHGKSFCENFAALKWFFMAHHMSFNWCPTYMFKVDDN